MLQGPGVCSKAAVGCSTRQTFVPGQALRPARPCKAAVPGRGLCPRLSFVLAARQLTTPATHRRGSLQNPGGQGGGGQWSARQPRCGHGT